MKKWKSSRVVLKYVCVGLTGKARRFKAYIFFSSVGSVGGGGFGRGRERVFVEGAGGHAFPSGSSFFFAELFRRGEFLFDVVEGFVNRGFFAEASRPCLKSRRRRIRVGDVGLWVKFGEGLFQTGLRTGVNVAAEGFAG